MRRKQKTVTGYFMRSGTWQLGVT